MKRLFPLLVLSVCVLSMARPTYAQSIYEPYSFSTFAGTPPGSTNDTGSAARFDGPVGTAVDNGGNIYVADSNNNTIRKITPAGVVSTLAGTPGKEGSTDGPASEALFFGPKGVAVDRVGNVYVADSGNDTIRKITAAGLVSTIAGAPGMTGSMDGLGAVARFNFPTGITVDADGTLYVADNVNDTIRKITTAGEVSTLAGLAGAKGHADGIGSAARFKGPSGVAVDSGGNVYVADSDNHTIRKIAPDGMVSTPAGSAGSPGFTTDVMGPDARFDAPIGVAVDSASNVYVADTANHTIRKITPAGFVSTPAGKADEEVGGGGSADGTGTGALFNKPSGVAVDSAGIVYVGDTHNNTIRRMTINSDGVGTVSTLAGLSGLGIADGLGSAARFEFPNGLALDGAGNLYVADAANSTIRKITSSGLVSTLAGSAGNPGSADGTGTAAQFNFPRGVALDRERNVYVSDRFNDTIRKITPAGEVTTLAGSPGVPGSDDGLGSEARFNQPYGIAVDDGNNVYVADTENNSIRKITPAGLVSTPVGSAAGFNRPGGMAIDGANNLFVADTDNHTIREVTQDGVVTTLAGLAGKKGNADGGPDVAQFFKPTGVAVDSGGNIYIGDSNNDIIRKLSPDGIVTTLAGLAGRRGGANGVGSVARFYVPRGMAVDSAGKLYVSDNLNNTIRLGVAAAPVITSPTFASGIVGTEFAYQFAASGATSLMVGGLPPGFPPFDPLHSTIAGNPTAAGTFLIPLSATNSQGTTTATLTLTIQPPPGSETSVVSGTGVTGGIGIGRPFSYQVKLTGVSASATIKADRLPPGLAIDEKTGLISGVLNKDLEIDDTTDFVTSAPVPDGSAPVILTVTDEGSPMTSNLQLVFTSDPAVPVIISPTQANVTSGQPFIYQIVAPSSLDSTGSQTTYSFAGTLPLGLNFDENTGTIFGTYTAPAKGAPLPNAGIDVAGGPLNIVGSLQLFARNARGTAEIPLLFTNAPPGAGNISTRLAIGTGDDVLIGGFMVTGSASKKLLIRAIGPSLEVNGVPLAGALADPILELHDSHGALLTSNDDWRSAQETEISATGIAPPNDHESAILATLEPGSYTAILRGKNDSTGIALVEVYDLGTVSLDISEETQLANISTRGKVEMGDMIGGFIIGGSSMSRVLVRALGPELAAQGVAGALQDTTLELRDRDGALLAFNDDWETDQETEILFTNAAPTDPREAAILRSLNPGAYTVIVRGKNNTTGIALMEVYVLP